MYNVVECLKITQSSDRNSLDTQVSFYPEGVKKYKSFCRVRIEHYKNKKKILKKVVEM